MGVIKSRAYSYQITNQVLFYVRCSSEAVHCSQYSLQYSWDSPWTYLYQYLAVCSRGNPCNRPNGHSTYWLWDWAFECPHRHDWQSPASCYYAEAACWVEVAVSRGCQHSWVSFMGTCLRRWAVGVIPFWAWCPLVTSLNNWIELQKLGCLMPPADITLSLVPVLIRSKLKSAAPYSFFSFR